MASGRPERQAPPEIFYNEEEARKYTSKCGSGLSGESLTEQGHFWVGLDISQHMLDVAVERETEGDLIQGDMGYVYPHCSGYVTQIKSITIHQKEYLQEITKYNIS
ncbi:hypothetical protein KUTeg_009783 [Tegillarca granosa]|uniref:Uncharacterized protein n=1 Tax=Tegillarca granosa TaxID=220873 RepID=A0ABQ9F4W6_TEGGR|nr:hypothetical protein KUTeg_009783 [Tegillarca granosa]